MTGLNLLSLRISHCSKGSLLLGRIDLGDVTLITLFITDPIVFIQGKPCKSHRFVVIMNANLPIIHVPV